MSIICVCFFGAAGVCQIIEYFAGHKNGVSGWLLATGIIDVILAVFLLRHAISLLVIAPFVAGIWAVIASLLHMGMGLDGRSNGQSRGFTFAMGCLLLVSGVIILIQPLIGIFSISYMFAITMFLLALQQIAATFGK